MKHYTPQRLPHTPGPWKTKWVRNSTYIQADKTDRDLSICRVMTHRTQDNTSILMHAPDMLAVLKYAETVLNMIAANAQSYDGKQLESSLSDLSDEIENVLNKIGENHA